MSISVELTAQEIAALKRVTKRDDEAEAVSCAAREYLRMSRLRQLKSTSGKVEWTVDWRELEALELDETPIPTSISSPT